MSSVIDTLQVVFTAETGALAARLNQINSQLVSLRSVSGAASASLKALAGALDFGLEGLTGGAYSAGAAVGAAFAAGLSSKRGAVSRAAGYISSAAISALGGAYYSGSKASAGAQATGFPSSVMSGVSGAVSGAVTQLKEITIPINVDGMKLGEACIKALGKVAGMTGRATLSI